MLVGMAVWRTRVIREPRRYRSLLWTFCGISGAIGILNTTADVLSQSSGREAHVPRLLAAIGSHVPLALAYAAGLIAWKPSQRVWELMRPVTAAGRMALTSYLTQSLVFALLFYGYGLGLFGRLDPTTAAGIGVALYAVLLWFSAWWFRQYRCGPFEWLWRSITYGHRQPMLVHNPIRSSAMTSRAGEA